MSDLELEKLELEKLELELELKKKEIELKKQELMQQEEVEVVEETVVEESQINLEKIERKAEGEKENSIVDIKEKKVLIDTKSKYFKIGMVAIFIGLIIFCAIFVQKNQQYYDNIPLIIENPEQYYYMTYEDVIEMYGEPDENGNFSYEMPGYSLSFSFKHGFVNMISYDPTGGFEFKQPSDLFYLFGLEDKKPSFM